MKTLLSCCALGVAICGVALGSPEPTTIKLWSGQPPGDKETLPPEADLNQPSDGLIAGRKIIRLGNVSEPTVTIYSPDPAKATGAAILVAPGGGYHILAMDLEGTEVCEWLNSIGVTAALLKYRVPARPGQPRYAAPLQDAQRALGLVRSRSAEFGIDPQRIGALGFSAGAHLSTMLGNQPDERTYPVVDAADAVSSRPNFVVLVYPGGLSPRDTDGTVLAPEVHVAKELTPPTFITMAQDDPVRVENALVYYRALKAANVPVEMHLYPKGGHGFGLRRTEVTATTWPDRVADWMKASGWLK